MNERRIQKKGDSDVVQWGAYDDEALEGHEEEIEEGPSSEFDKLEVGRNARRILPPPRGSGWGKNGTDTPLLTVWQHIFMVGDNMMKFACPQKEAKQPCFACTESTRMRRSAIPAEKDKGFELKAKRRAYLQWFDPSEDEPEIKVYEAGKTIREALVDFRREKGDYSHPTKGYEVVIKRKGTSRKDTDYSIFAGDDCPLSDFGFQPEDLLDLESYAIVPTAEELDEYISVIQEFVGYKAPRSSSRRQLRSGRDKGEEDRPRRSRRRDEDEGGEDDRPRGRRGGRNSRGESSRRGGATPRSYDPDEDDGPIIEAEPAEEAPRRSGRRRRRG